MTVDLDDFEIAARYAVQIRQLLFSSSLQAEQLMPVQYGDLLDPNARPMPTWPSGLYSDFDALFGGFRGLTVLAGPSGCGKSMHALACGLESAMSPGTCVVYLDAENSLGDQIARARNWWGSDADFRSNMQAMALRFHWLEVMPGHSWKQLMQSISQRVLLDHERVLLILDSVSSVARCLGGNALDTSSRIYQQLRLLVRASEGRIRALALSPLNREGGVRGLEGVYDSDLALKLEHERDSGEGAMRMRMLKHRGGPTRSDLGLYQLDYSINRIRRFDEPGRNDRAYPDPYGVEH